MKAFIFAAGLGTRLFPYTKSQPKALVPLLGKPMLQHLILKLKSYHITDIIINIHHFGQQIIDFLNENNHFGCQITISDERDLLLNTGGGLKKALSYLVDGEDLLVHNVDILSDLHFNDLMQFHKKQQATISLLVQKRNTSRYLLFNKEKELCGWLNKKTGAKIPDEIKPANYHEFAFNGIHIINKKALELFPEEDSFPLIPVYLKISQSKKISAFEMEDQFWLDLGKPETIKIAENWLKNV